MTLEVKLQNIPPTHEVEKDFQTEESTRASSKT